MHLTNKNLVKILSRNSKEQEKLVLHKGVVMRMACYNHSQNPRHIYSQGQLAITDFLPEPFAAHHSYVIVVLVSPGERNFSTIREEKTRLEIKIRESIPVMLNVHYLHSRRVQYCLQPNISSTVYGAIGKRVPEISLEISHSSESKL